MSEILVKVENVSKKFCRSLKRSLWYGMQDLGKELVGKRHGGNGELRPHEFWAVKDVSFELRRGECLGLIGCNGAGKTTLLRMLNGLIKPDNGRIEMRGRVGALIALGAGFNPILTGRENIYVNASILGLSSREINEKLERILDFADIGEFIDAPVQNYSSGMAVRLGFAVASVLDPDVLILDEILSVGDLNFQAKCFNTLSALRKNGTAFILVSHNMHVIAQQSTSVLYLKSGNSEFCGNPNEAISRYIADTAEKTQKAKSNPTFSYEEFKTKKINIEAIDFLDKCGNKAQIVNVGEDFYFSIKYCLLENLNSRNLYIDLVIYSFDGSMLFHAPFYKTDALFQYSEKQNEYRLKFVKFPINEDIVFFSFAIIDVETQEIYAWVEKVSLNIRKDGLQTGRTKLDVEWIVS
ncbi:MAG: ABC transporter ATP-binding protein [Candidatus Loosdrechtia sp.]|uniref:ABC transporter ATP-binding protein n=1 Tax=Candidatus Loosdrechtia sp. TaxID=3101272 RepID=UPI003A669E65|nr:MAG: ABC transporter ATP-binding protein [Candidatus Jettenia sp. AMX2]